MTFPKDIKLARGRVGINSLFQESGFSAAPFTEEQMNTHWRVAFYVPVLQTGKDGYQMLKNICIYIVPLKSQAM